MIRAKGIGWVLLLAALLLPSVWSKADHSRLFADEAMVQAYISSVYQSISFEGGDRLSYDVFSNAMKGYLNLRNAGKLDLDREILSVCDFDLPSTEPRLWVIDLAEKKVLFNTFVAHGQGSGEDCANCFSNQNESHQSSLGFYVTAETYEGDHGFSLKLDGMEIGFNDAARDRGIVIHGADYVSEEFISGNQRLGRSWGCPAIRESLKIPVINCLKGGTCLFIYHTDNKYLKRSYWINKKVDRLPVQANTDFPIPVVKKHKLIVEYRHGQHLDSLVEIALPVSH